MSSLANRLKKIDERFFRAIPEENTKLGHGVSGLILLAWLCLGIFVVDRAVLFEKIFLISAMMGSLVINTGIKYVIGRERPSKIDAFSDKFHFGIQKTSFPSCHAQLAFTALVLVERFHPSLLLLVFLLALITAVSRLTIGRHWFSDIVVGIMAGYFVGKIFILVL